MFPFYLQAYQTFYSSIPNFCFRNTYSGPVISENKDDPRLSSEDWENFSKLFSPTTAGELSFLCKNIFKNNESKNTWTPKEDIELKKLILENNQKHLPWKKIAEKFNKALDLPNYKKPSQCSERWKNVLSKKCKKGEWTKGEDLIIISFVKKYGSKWSKLAKMIPDRTEHNIKNRFFSLISKQFEIPILRIKQSFNYLDPKILEEVKMSLND